MIRLSWSLAALLFAALCWFVGWWVHQPAPQVKVASHVICPEFFRMYFVGMNSLVIPADVHKKGLLPVAACLDNSRDERLVLCTYSVDARGWVTFVWNPPFTGSIVIYGGQVAGLATIDSAGRTIRDGEVHPYAK